MASCELCSRPATTKARIEGVTLNVCVNCASFGSVVKAAPPPLLAKKIHSLRDEETSTFLSEDAGIRLRKARQKIGLSEKNAAAKLNMKESTLMHFEAGKITPDEATIRKLEKFYAIKLTQTLQ